MTTITHYSGTVRKTLASGAVVSSSYVDTDAGESLYVAPTARSLTIDPGTQALTVTFSREVFSDESMSVSLGTSESVSTSTVFYATAGTLTMSAAQSDGTVIYSGGVDLDPTTPVLVEPAPSAAQMADDISRLSAAGTATDAAVGAVEDKIFSTFTWSMSTVETATGTHRMYNDTGRTLTISAVRISATDVATSALTVDVNKNGTTIFSTQADRPSIAASGSTDKAVPNVTSWADGEYLTVDVDAVGTATDLTVTVTAS